MKESTKIELAEYAFKKNQIKIQEAIDFAARIHSLQWRKGLGVPYLIHPLQVLNRLAKWNITLSTNGLHPWLLAILHDTAEESGDPNETFNEIELLFGTHICNLVKVLSYFPNSDTRTKEEYLSDLTQAHYDVFLVKLSDRICNVYDFIDTSPSYAPKYFDKAQALFDAIQVRKSDIEMMYGLKTFDSILGDWGSLISALQPLRKI